MKIYIGPYKNWFGPYQLAEALCFWAKPVKDEYGIEGKPDWVHNFGEWLAGYKDDGNGNDIGKPSLLYRFLLWIESKRKRKIDIRIDRWDTWSMDTTLAPIILPMLKQLKETKHGSPYVELEDVPKEMQLTTTEEYSEQQCFDFYNDPDLTKQNIQCDIHDRWNWVLDEMIWAFEQINSDSDWKDQYIKGSCEVTWKKTEIGHEMVANNFQIDMKGIELHQQRIKRGLTLFGKYYQALWD
jgi:hypothetical protein